MLAIRALLLEPAVTLKAAVSIGRGEIDAGLVPRDAATGMALGLLLRVQTGT